MKRRASCGVRRVRDIGCTPQSKSYYARVCLRSGGGTRGRAMHYERCTHSEQLLLLLLSLYGCTAGCRRRGRTVVGRGGTGKSLHRERSPRTGRGRGCVAPRAAAGERDNAPRAGGEGCRDRIIIFHYLPTTRRRRFFASDLCGFFFFFISFFRRCMQKDYARRSPRANR